jgi:hypothetical protein
MTFVRTKKIVVAVGAVAALALAPVAEAHTATGSTSTTIRYRSGAFRGRISSNQNFCLANRNVKLYKIRRGPDRFLKSTRSSSTGRWRITRRRRPGRYYVVVASKSSGTYGHLHRCGIAQSRTVRLS